MGNWDIISLLLSSSPSQCSLSSEALQNPWEGKSLTFVWVNPAIISSIKLMRKQNGQ